MGVKDLWSVLLPVGKPSSLGELRGKTLAVDLSGWLFQSEGASCLKTKQFTLKPHLRSVFWRVFHLLQNQARVVVVLEGATPEIKAASLRHRQQNRIKYGTQAGLCAQSKTRAVAVHDDNHSPTKLCSVLPEESGSAAVSSPSQACHGVAGEAGCSRTVNSATILEVTGTVCHAALSSKHRQVCELLDCLGVAYVQSPTEAEALCAVLDRSGKVDGCITDDNDAFLFGATTVYRNFSGSMSKVDHCVRYAVRDVEETLALSRNHLVAMALLMGCDYDEEGVPGVGKEHAFKLMQSIPGSDVLDRLRHWKTNSQLEQLELCRAKKRPCHCGGCGHEGSRTSHKSKGCGPCHTTVGCEPSQPAPVICPCDWHRQSRECHEHDAELKVRKRAAQRNDFPQEKVIEAYMSADQWSVAGLQLEWKEPNFAKLKEYCGHYFGWRDGKAEEMLVPVMTAHHMSAISQPQESSRKEALVPDAILKETTHRGTKMLHISWSHIGGVPEGRGVQLKTTEVKQTVAKCFPDLVQEFTQRQEDLRASKKRKRPCGAPHPLATPPNKQPKINQMFAVRKRLIFSPSSETSPADHSKDLQRLGDRKITSQHHSNPAGEICDPHPGNPDNQAARAIVSQDPANPVGEIVSQHPANPVGEIVSQDPANPVGEIISQDPANSVGEIVSESFTSDEEEDDTLPKPPL